MLLTVTRQNPTALSTSGLLAVNGVFECYTLEPAAPIPAGVYTLALAFSPHFQTVTPHVLAVPGFTAIEIHWGNFPRDTRGCLLVGQTRAANFVGNSREAFRSLMRKLCAAHAAGESIVVEYSSAPHLAVTDPELAA